jgi:hypothetical protein
MVDQLISCDEERTCTIFHIKEDNVLVDNGELTEAGLTENIAQTAAAGAGYEAKLRDESVKTGYIGAIKNLEIFELPKTGEVIETEVIVQNKIFDVTIIRGNVRCRGALMATCEMKIFIKN